MASSVPTQNALYSLRCSLWVDRGEWGLSEKLKGRTNYWLASLDLAKGAPKDYHTWAYMGL
jgi:hypothetical protein